jgi:electron transport complex protein RnfC
MGLSPNTVYEMLNQGLTQKAAEEGARDCIACGSCSYICPAGIDLTAKIALFASEGRVIEVNSLLYNSGHTATEGELIYDTSEMTGGSLLEEYEGETTEDGRDEEGRIVLPFDGGKKV